MTREEGGQQAKMMEALVLEGTVHHRTPTKKGTLTTERRLKLLETTNFSADLSLIH